MPSNPVEWKDTPRDPKQLTEPEYLLMGDIEGSPTRFYGDVAEWPSRTPLSRKFADLVCASRDIKTWQDLRRVEFEIWLKHVKVLDAEHQEWQSGKFPPGSPEFKRILTAAIEHAGKGAEANTYSGLPLSILIIDLIVSMLGIYGHNSRYKRIVEIGCSRGDLTAFLAAVFPECEVIGVEVSRNALMQARATQPNLPNLKFIQADALDEEFRRGLFAIDIATLSIFSRFISQLAWGGRIDPKDAVDQSSSHADLVCQWLVHPSDAVIVSEANRDAAAYIQGMASRVARNRGSHTHVFHQNIGPMFIREEFSRGSIDTEAFAAIFFAPDASMLDYYGFPAAASKAKDKTKTSTRPIARKQKS